MWLFLTIGCAEYDLGRGKSQEAADDAGSETSNGTPTTTPDSDSGESDANPPAWYALDATLTVASGEAVTDAAAVMLTVVGEDLANVVCEVPLSVAGIVPATPDTTTAAPGAIWWSLPVEPSEESCAVLPAVIAIGVGELLPDVRAQLGTVGLEGVADALYGAYTQADGGPVWTFGWAGTDSDRAGDSEATLPAPDGQYTIASLFLVPLPAQ